LQIQESKKYFSSPCGKRPGFGIPQKYEVPQKSGSNFSHGSLAVISAPGWNPDLNIEALEKGVGVTSEEMKK